MPGLVSTLLNQTYSMPARLVQTFLQVIEQVWHPIHLSRLSTMRSVREPSFCRLLLCSGAPVGSAAGHVGGIISRLVEPVHFAHLAHNNEFVTIGADGPVIIEAVGELGVAADHVRRLHVDAGDRVVDAARSEEHTSELQSLMRNS